MAIPSIDEYFRKKEEQQRKEYQAALEKRNKEIETLNLAGVSDLSLYEQIGAISKLPPAPPPERTVRPIPTIEDYFASKPTPRKTTAQETTLSGQTGTATKSPYLLESIQQELAQVKPASADEIRNWQKRQSTTVAERMRLAADIESGKVKVSDLKPEQIPWDQLMARPGYTSVAALGMRDPKKGYDYLVQLQGRMTGAAEERQSLQRPSFATGLAQGLASGIALGVPEVAPGRTTAERAGQFVGQVAGMIPGVAAAAATGGAALSGLAARAIPALRGTGTAARVVSGILQGIGTGAALAPAQEALRYRETGEFDPKEAAKRAGETIATYGAFGGAYPVAEPVTGALARAVGRVVPGAAAATRAVSQTAPIVSDVVRGGTTGAIAGGIVGAARGAGKAVLGSPEVQSAADFVRYVLQEAKEEAAEEIVEAVAFGIVRGRIARTPRAVREAVDQAKAEVAAERAATPAPETTPEPATATETQAETPTPVQQEQVPSMRTRRSEMLRQAMPGIDETAVMQIVRDTNNLSDEEFAAFVQRMTAPETETPATEPPATEARAEETPASPLEPAMAEEAPAQRAEQPQTSVEADQTVPPATIAEVNRPRTWSWLRERAEAQAKRQNIDLDSFMQNPNGWRGLLTNPTSPMHRLWLYTKMREMGKPLPQNVSDLMIELDSVLNKRTTGETRAQEIRQVQDRLAAAIEASLRTEQTPIERLLAGEELTTETPAETQAEAAPETPRSEQVTLFDQEDSELLTSYRQQLDEIEAEHAEVRKQWDARVQEVAEYLAKEATKANEAERKAFWQRIKDHGYIGPYRKGARGLNEDLYRRLPRTVNHLKRKDGVPLDELASALGYESEDAFVNDIIWFANMTEVKPDDVWNDAEYLVRESPESRELVELLNYYRQAEGALRDAIMELEGRLHGEATATRETEGVAVTDRRGDTVESPEGAVERGDRERGEAGAGEGAVTRAREAVESVQEELRGRVEAVEGSGIADTRIGIVHPAMRETVARSATTVDVPALDPETEERFQAAKRRPAGESPLQSLRRWWGTVKQYLTSDLPYLPPGPRHARLAFMLRQLKKARGTASDQAALYLQGITTELNRDEYNLFNRAVVYADLMEDVDKGLYSAEDGLPFFKTVDELRMEHKRVMEAVSRNENVQRALETRKKTLKAVSELYATLYEKVNGKPPPFNRQDYFHHEVLNRLRADSRRVRGTGEKVKVQKAGWLKARKGTEYDYLTNYLEVEHKVLAEMIYGAKVYEVIDYVAQNYDISARLKAEAKRLSEETGQKVSWRDLAANVEGYTIWQPDEGNYIFRANAIDARLVDEMMAKGLEELNVPRDKIREVLAIGGRKMELVIPQEVADTLNHFGKAPPREVYAGIDGLVRKLMGYWKKHQLLFITRAFKYNVRNLTGDADAVIAGNPTTFTKMGRALNDLYSFLVRGSAPSKELQAWMERGGMQDVLGIAEDVTQIDALKQFRRFAEQPTIKRMVQEGDWQGLIKKLQSNFAFVAKYTNMREYWLRYAAFLDYLEQIQKNGRPNNWGASVREEVMALGDPYDMAYELSNDLLGAYDKVSVAGQWVRDRLIPFWSWNEVNARRYKRLLENAIRDGEGTAFIGRMTMKKLTGLATKSPIIAYNFGKFVLKAHALSALLAAWNYIMFRDEEEELPEHIRSKAHIVLGRDEDGKVVYFSRLGAIADFYEWFGLDAAPQYVREYLNGRMTLKEIAEDMLSSPLNKVVQGLGPSKTVAEVMLGKTVYPDIRHPRVIRDKGEFLADSLAMGDIYREAFGMPTRGKKAIVQGLFTYRLDPAETAYSEIISKKYDWLTKKKGMAGADARPSAKSNALYYFKKAIRYGDKEAADRYLMQYFEYGGTVDGLRQSLRTLDPLYGMSDAEKAAFISQLTERERYMLQKAQEFYRDVILGNVATD